MCCLRNIARRDYQESVTTGQTDAGSLFTAMIHRRHNKLHVTIILNLARECKGIIQYVNDIYLYTFYTFSGFYQELIDDATFDIKILYQTPNHLK